MATKQAGHVAQAVGSYEAAALMGVHWSRPSKLAAAGKLSAHTTTSSAWVADPSRAYAIYDGGECDRDYHDYEEETAARGGKSARRPRAWLHLRPEALRRLKAVKHRIAFDDAISVAEAARILHVHATFVPRLVAAGKIIGRQPWNPRTRESRIWIISRASCVSNVRETKAAQASGQKPGRPRKKLA